MRYLVSLPATAPLSLVLAVSALAQAPSGTQNEANNPLTPKMTLNVQDQWAASFYDTDGSLNSLLLRGLLPNKLFGRPQLLRFTLPIVTTPDPGGTTGLGDLNLIDLFPFRTGRVELGIGPQVTLPTATEDATGTGKWQGGAAGVLIAPQHWGLLGTLVTWQASFAGDDDRAHQNNLTAQPFFIYNLPQGWYLRSSGVLTFDLENDRSVMPIGVGVGKVFVKSNGRTINVFAEPQFTVVHEGAGQPKFQMYSGINLQFPLKPH